MAMLNFPYALRALFSIAILAAFLPIQAQDASSPDEGHPSVIVEANSVLTGEAFDQAENLYQRKCGACHSLDHNRVGPSHRGVFGAKAGSVDDFRYSRALQSLDVIWDEKTLDEWLQNPPRFARGTSMGFSVQNAEERAQIIAYLKSVPVTPKEE